MDHSRFEHITRSLTDIPSRRDVLRGLAGAVLGLSTVRLSDAVEARNKGQKNKKGKKQKGKKKKPALVLNQFGCLNVGQACRGNSTLCCSGICQGAAPKKGKPDTSQCVAHNTGTCTQEGAGICGATNPAALRCNNSINCGCIQTTGGSNFCYDGVANGKLEICTTCSKDADCDALGFPPGSACAPISTGNCAGLCATGMACLAPCGT